jgi:hypothetical protein
MRKTATIIFGIGVGAVGLWGSSQAFAGLKTTEDVLVTPIPGGGKVAVGQLGAARNSVDTIQHIGCYARQVVLPSASLTIHCGARGADGETLSCSSTNASLLPIIGSIGSDSRLGFGVDAAGNCTYILVDASSKYQPKKP